MKHFLTSIALLMGLQTIASAQAPSKVDVFAGFSILNYDGFGGFSRDTAYGGQASVTWNAKRWLGLTADFGGQYKHYDANIFGAAFDSKNYEFIFGPQFAYRIRRATFFTHSLFGALHHVASAPVSSAGAGVNVSFGDTSFLMGFGGGLDINVSRHFGFRLVQFDWLPAHHNGEWATDAIRLGFGVVVK